MPFRSLPFLYLHLPVYQAAVKTDALGSALGTVDIVIMGNALRNLVQEGVFDGSALLAEGIA